MVNPNYKEINAEEQLKRPDSVFHYYQKLIQLRKENEIIVYGNYALLLPEDRELYVYTRTLGQEKLLVICNFYGNTREFELPEDISPDRARLLIGNCETVKIERKMEIRPYEAVVLKMQIR